MTDTPRYPTWIKSSRIRLFWLLTAGVVLIGAIAGLLWPPAWTVVVLALPFAYIAILITLASRRLSPSGDDLQRRIHELIVTGVGEGGRLLDIGCGSGQLVIRLANASPGEYVGLDFWPGEWGEYSRALAERNAEAEGARSVTFVNGTASALPFDAASFDRVVSCMTFHEVRDVEDKTVSLAEAMRVLAPGGRFAVVDLFDDPRFYPGRTAALDALRAAGAEVSSDRPISEIYELRWPMNTGNVLKYAVLVTGTKR